jgi:thiol-disulfide isomerase/thioredoxin
MRSRARHAAARLALAVIAAAAAPGTPLAAQTISGFTLSGDYVIDIDGVASPTTRIYWSPSARAFLLVVKDQSAPLLVEPRLRQVKSVPLVKLATRPDGTVAILEGAVMTPKGATGMADSVISFNVDGRAYRLQERPPLLGWQTPETIVAYSSTYDQRAAAYQPQPSMIAELKKQSADVKLTVFFGSWCPFCQQKVPLAIRLARELAGSKVKIDFYGLPHGFTNDATAQRYNVKSVPTGIVYKDGKEVGRISADGWALPEGFLLKLVKG